MGRKNKNRQSEAYEERGLLERIMSSRLLIGLKGGLGKREKTPDEKDLAESTRPRICKEFTDSDEEPTLQSERPISGIRVKPEIPARAIAALLAFAGKHRIEITNLNGGDLDTRLRIKWGDQFLNRADTYVCSIAPNSRQSNILIDGLPIEKGRLFQFSENGCKYYFTFNNTPDQESQHTIDLNDLICCR
jgi:hypothetical protein